MFGIVTHVDNNISVDVYPESADFHTIITQTAINWIYDNAGKNNYNETLASDAPESLCPAGYVLKYSQSKAPERYINLYYNSEVDDNGWIFSGKRMNTVSRGFFGKVKIGINEPLEAAKNTILTLERRLKSANDELDRQLGVVDYQHSEPKKQSICGKSDLQDEMIRLIKNFDFKSLRPVAGIYCSPASENVEEYEELVDSIHAEYEVIGSDSDEYESDETESDYSSD
jgi:hypothetical protein